MSRPSQTASLSFGTRIVISALHLKVNTSVFVIFWALSKGLGLLIDENLQPWHYIKVESFENSFT